jgi:hypothetical protein
MLEMEEQGIGIQEDPVVSLKNSSGPVSQTPVNGTSGRPMIEGIFIQLLSQISI